MVSLARGPRGRLRCISYSRRRTGRRRPDIQASRSSLIAALVHIYANRPFADVYRPPGTHSRALPSPRATPARFRSVRPPGMQTGVRTPSGCTQKSDSVSPISHPQSLPRQPAHAMSLIHRRSEDEGRAPNVGRAGRGSSRPVPHDFDQGRPRRSRQICPASDARSRPLRNGQSPRVCARFAIKHGHWKKKGECERESKKDRQIVAGTVTAVCQNCHKI